MSVSLTPELEQLVNEKVASGRFTSVDDVVREGLRLIEERDERLQELRHQIQLGVESADRGELIDSRIVFANLRRKLQQIADETPS